MSNPSRRHLLHRLLAGAAGLGATASSYAHTVGSSEAPFACWVHGHCTDIGFPDRIESATSTGGSKLIRGRSYSHNRLHYGLTVPARETRVRAILLRFRTLPGATLESIHLFDGEREVVILDSLGLQQPAWAERRIIVPGEPGIERGLGVTLGIGFGDVDREFEISAVGAEFTGRQITA